jgi:splicing suppressor protein 51
MQNQGSQFQKPDLCIAFNSGASAVLTHTWLPTLKLLIESKIPTVFTVRRRDVRVPHLFTNNDPLQSYNREEAEDQAALLRAAGAKLHPAVGPTRNPWESIKLHHPSPKVYCTISTKCSSKLCNFSSEKAEKISFELRRFLHTSKNLGCHASLNTWSK